MTGDVYKTRETSIQASVRLRSLPPPFFFPILWFIPVLPHRFWPVRALYRYLSKYENHAPLAQKIQLPLRWLFIREGSRYAVKHVTLLQFTWFATLYCGKPVLWSVVRTLRGAWPLPTERMRSSSSASEPATLHCWKPTQTSSNPPQIPCVPFAKRSRRQSSTGYGGAPGSLLLLLLLLRYDA